MVFHVGSAQKGPSPLSYIWNFGKSPAKSPAK
jgi:hypothetical protein